MAGVLAGAVVAVDVEAAVVDAAVAVVLAVVSEVLAGSVVAVDAAAVVVEAVVAVLVASVAAAGAVAVAFATDAIKAEIKRTFCLICFS